MKHNGLRKVATFLGMNTNMAAMLGLVVVIGIGERMAERFLPVYVLAVGGTAITVGILGGMQNLLGALYSFPGGYLSDKLGYKRSLLLFTCVAMVGYAIVIIIPHWIAVLVGALFFIAWSAVSLPAVMSLVAESLPKNKRTMGVSLHSLIRRIPMALGPLIGGVLILNYGNVTGIRVAYAFAFLIAIAALIFVTLFMKNGGKTNPEKEDGSPRDSANGSANGTVEPREKMNPGYYFSLLIRLKPLRNLLVSDILIRFAEQIPYAFVVIWAMMSDGVTALQYGILTTVEMATAMLIYIPVAYLADKSVKKPFVIITFCFFTLFPLVLLFSKTFILLLAAFVIRGLKEFGEPTRKSLIMDLAPEKMKAGVFGTYYLVRDTIVSIAAFAGAFLWNVSPATNFLAAFGFGLLGTLYFVLFGSDLGGKNPEPAKRS